MGHDAIRTGREDLLHILVDRLTRRGFDDIGVSTLEEFEGKRPPVIFWEKTDEGFMPDLSARKGGKTYIFAVETAAPFDERARRRIALFTSYAGIYRRHFCLIVPQAALNEGRKELSRTDVDERFIHLVGL